MAESEKIVIRSRLGEQVLDQKRVISFPKGLIGFRDKNAFALLQIKPGSPFFMLQCLDDPEFGLVVTDPFGFLPEYGVDIGEAEQRILELESERDLAVLVSVTIPQGRPEETTLNLSGPILINVAKRVGLQVPQTNPGLASHFRLSDCKQGE